MRLLIPLMFSTRNQIPMDHFTNKNDDLTNLDGGIGHCGQGGCWE